MFAQSPILDLRDTGARFRVKMGVQEERKDQGPKWVQLLPSWAGGSLLLSLTLPLTHRGQPQLFARPLSSCSPGSGPVQADLSGPL